MTITEVLPGHPDYVVSDGLTSRVFRLRGIGWRPKLILAILAGQIDCDIAETGRAILTFAELAQFYRATNRTVRKHLAPLLAAGLVTATPAGFTLTLPASFAPEPLPVRRARQ